MSKKEIMISEGVERYFHRRKEVDLEIPNAFHVVTAVFQNVQKMQV